MTGGATTGGTTTGGTMGPSDLLGLPPAMTPTAHLHKLTTMEFANSVHDLLGSAAPVPNVEPDLIVDGFASLGASSVAISPSGVGLYETAIASATAFAFADATHAASVLPCVPQSMTDTACFTRAIAEFGRRAYRRPLTAPEATLFAGVATTIGNQAGSSVLIALRHTVNAILQSPGFLYREELGTPSPQDGGRLKYDGFEMASRLAGTLWTSVPDDALLDVADTLVTPDGIRAQAQRMLVDTRVHRTMAAFVDQLFDAQKLRTTDKDPQMFPTWTTSLRDAMLQELELRIDDMAFTQKGNFFDLFQSRTTFVNNELARHYGLPEAGTDGFRKVEFPADSPRAGLLGAGAILVSHAYPQRTSPTSRGKFVNEMLLCRFIAPPPNDVPPLPPTLDPNQTFRQVLTVHRTEPRCAACHGVMDPVGFGMEYFDTTAKYRTTDHGQPVDATGDLDGAKFSNLAELGAAMQKEEVLGPCLISKMYANALGRVANQIDGPALDGLAVRFASGGNRVDAMLVDLVTSDSFRFVEPSQ